MKVLVTGRAIPHNPKGSTGQQLAEGFKQAGHQCVFYGNFYGEFYNFLGAKEVQGADFDLVVVTEMNDGMPGYEPLFEYYKLKNVPRLYWDFDVSYHPNQSIRRATMIKYNGYLVANSLFLDYFDFDGTPTLHLPYACSPQIHRRKPEIQREHLVGFIGSITAEREWLKDRVHCITGVFGEDLIDETNKISTMIHINQNACKGLVPGRPWEAAGCGSTLLMDSASYEDFAPLILDALDSSSVIPFDTVEDIDAFKNHYNIPSWRKYLEESGRRLMEYMHANHTYKNRAEAIIQWAKDKGIL